MNEPGIANAVATVDTLLSHALPDNAAAVQQHIVSLLEESAPLYQGLARQQADQIRAQLMAGLAQVGCPAAASPFILEELLTGDSPYAAAAAARALHGCTEPIDWAAKALVDSLVRMAGADQVVDFGPVGSSRSPNQTKSTFQVELLRAISMINAIEPTVINRLRELRDERVLSKKAQSIVTAILADNKKAAPENRSCCGSPSGFSSQTQTELLSVDQLMCLECEDQQARVLRFDEVFCGHVNVVAFFYTRCMNLKKCSATIEQMNTVQEYVDRRQLDCRLGAFSYDPAYDTAARLKAYGNNRGVGEDSALRLLRCPGGITALQQFFDLKVGFDSSTVNRHRIELFVCDRDFSVIEKLTDYNVSLSTGVRDHLARKFAIETGI